MKEKLQEFKKWCDSTHIFDDDGIFRFDDWYSNERLSGDMIKDLLLDQNEDLNLSQKVEDLLWSSTECPFYAELSLREYLKGEAQNSPYKNVPINELTEWLAQIGYDCIALDEYADTLINSTSNLKVNLLFGTREEENTLFTSNLGLVSELLNASNKNLKVQSTDNMLYQLIQSQGYTLEDVAKVLDGDETESKFLQSLANEIEEMFDYPMQLGAMVEMSLRDLVKLSNPSQRDLISITFKAGSSLALVDCACNGTCSNLEIELEKDFVVDVSSICAIQVEGHHEKGFTILFSKLHDETPYEVGWYTVDDICGLVPESWSENKWELNLAS